jgi:DNA topoisomerase-6 subunit B
MDMDPHTIEREDAKRLLDAFQKVKIMSPPTDCLSPIGEELIYKGLEKEFNVDFIATTTRTPSVYSGNPFVVEVGIAYGGNLQKDDRVNIMRFANRVPLLYQQGGCVTTHGVEGIKWKQYGIDQPGGGLPIGPLVLLIHVASTNVPFTSESKDAIADIPEIQAEVELALKEAGRKLNRFLKKKGSLKKRKEKEVIINKVLPRMAEKLAETLDREVPDINPVVARVMGNLLVDRQYDDGNTNVSIRTKNFGSKKVEFKLHEMLPFQVEATPSPKVVSMGNDYDYIWKIVLKPGEAFAVNYRLPDPSDVNSIRETPIVEGVEEEIVTGARAIKGVV